MNDRGQRGEQQLPADFEIRRTVVLRWPGAERWFDARVMGITRTAMGAVRGS